MGVGIINMDEAFYIFAIIALGVLTLASLVLLGMAILILWETIKEIKEEKNK